MKKFYSYLGILAFFLAITSLNAQVFVSENFDSAFPTGWTTGGVNDSGVPQATGFSQSTAQACDVGSVRANAYNTIPIRWLQSIPQTANGGDIEVSFEYKIVDWSAATNPTPANFGTANLQYSIGGGPWITYHTIDDLNHTPSNVCETLTHTITGVPLGSSFDWRIYVIQANGDYYFYVDTFLAVELADCFDPINVQATATSSSEAVVSWDSVVQDAIQWNIEYGSSGFTPGTGTTIVTTTNPYSISGLTAVTEYDVYIQADCGSGVFSGWVGPLTFETWPDCTNFTLSVIAVDDGICYEGSATLNATAGGSGNDIFWYDAALGGNLVGVGSTFDTPYINATTSFWVAEVVHSGNLTGQAFDNPTVFTNSTSNSNGLIFTVNSPIVLVDVEVFGTNANSGDITIELRDIDNGNATIASTTASITGGGTAASPIPHTIPLNFGVPAAGNYRLVRTASTATVGLGYVSAANSNFPYPLGSSGEVTGGSSLTGTTTLQYFFFNWTIIETTFCESTRDEAIATVYDFIPVEASATATQVNPNGATTLTATSTNPNYIYTWEPAASIAGSNVGASVTTTALTAHTDFTVTAIDSVTDCEATDDITILVFNTALCNTLAITNSFDGYICDEGTVELSATSSGTGDEIYWYDAAVGGNRVGAGTTFETPLLTQTTSYWATEVLEEGGSTSGQGKATYSAATSGNSTSGSSWGLVFDAYEAFTIQDVEVYSTGNGGDITIQLQDNTGTMIEEVTVNVPGGGTPTAPVPYTAVLNMDVPAAGTYRLLRTTSNPATVNLIRESSGNTYPYPLGTVGSITSGYISGTSTAYYWFYNWTVSTAFALCESTREEVIAIVVDTDPVEATATATQIDPGNSTTLTATSTNTNYNYVWTWDGGTDNGASILVTPANHTTYTVTATDSVTGCVATDEITILVFNTALCITLDVTAATGGYVCDEGTTTLSATGSGTGSDIYWYDAQTDGNLLGTGSSFEIPSITTTTSYWAAEALLEITPLTGQSFANPTTFTNSTSNAGGLLFTVTSPINIIDVQVFGTNTTGGDITIELRDIDNGNATIATTTATITGGGSTASPIPHTIPLNFAVPSAGNYRLVRSGATPSGVGLGNVSSANSNFPYPLGSSGEVTGGSTLTGTSITQFFFFNWTIEEIQYLCESPREEVIAIVVDTIPVEASATQTSINPGNSTTLTATSTNTNYTYVWTWDGGTDTGASIIVSPSDHTFYTVTATDGITGCITEDVIQILVFNLALCNPLDITSTTGDTICIGETATLTATASGTGSIIRWYDDEFNGNIMGIGASYETPVLTSTTSFWAAEVLFENYIAPIEAAYTSGGLTFFDATNGTGITFAVENTNAQEVKMRKLDFYMPANTSFTFELWYHPTNITGSPGIISAANGWIQIAGPEFVTSGPTNGIYNAFSNLSFEIPATTTYRFILIGTGAGSQFTYVNDAGSPNMFSSGGVNLLVGNNSAGATGNVGYSGQNPLGTSIGTNPRYFYGAIDFNVELCESDREEAIATVTSDDAPTGVINQTFAAGETLADLDVTGVNLTWYSDASGTTVLPETTLLVDGETYCVSQTVNGCESQLLCITVALIQPCDAPTALTIVGVTDTTAEISWTASATETGGYAWYVFADGDNPATDPSIFNGTVATGVTSVIISGLTAATDYDIYVSTFCTGGVESTLAGPLNILTDALACDAPTALTEVAVTDTTVEVSWTASATETGGYAWYVFADGDNPLTDPSLFDGTVATGVTSVIISGLTAATDYDIYVSTLCTGGIESGLAGPLDVLTDVGGIVFPAPYCAANFTNCSWESITNVTFVGINNTTGCNSGINDYTGQVATVNRGSTYPLSVTIDPDSSDYIYAFIDWNQNDELDDTGEVYTVVSNTNAAGPHTINIDVPANAVLGNTRMRIILEWDSTGPDPCVSRTFGEVEDYTIEVLPALPVCPEPLAINIDAVTETTIDFSWTPPTDISDVEGYYWRLMNSGDDPLVDPSVDEDYVPGAASTSAMITGLTQGTDYDLYLVTVCDEITLFISNPLMVAVTTDAVCDIPTNVTVVEEGVDSAEFSWTASATETNGYEWAVFNSGDDPLVDPAVATGTVATGVTSVIVTGLDENTTYDFYVRTDCDPDGFSNWEGPLTFTTDEGASVNDFDINSIVFYPNPMVDVVNVSAQIEIEKVVIFSITGQKLTEQRVGNTETQIDVSNFATGPYLIQVTTSTGKLGIFRLIKK